MTKEEYLTGELERTIDLIKHFHDQKLEYKKLFVAAISVALTITMVILNFPGPKDSSNVATLNKLLPSERLIGVVMALQGLIGFFISKTLASLRVSEVVHHNTYTQLTAKLRSAMAVHGLPAPHTYSVLNRGGADYLSLAAVSFASGLFVVFGVCLTADTFTLSNYFVTIGVPVIYIAAHCKVIEATLHEQPTK